MSAPASAKRSQIVRTISRLGEVEQVVVALLVLQQVQAAAIVGLLQPLGLDLRAVGAVLDQDALGGFGAKDLGGAHACALTPSRWQIA